ncbi:hypothetical protein CbuD7D7780_05770 [Coxiella burnetii]|uniref:DinB family protein n=1 Tax=Coxiella burnetii (strain Dugway 5J108-111) TaxID=434922 RepID=A9KCJ5_COXBN|nr:DNA damage-inducible protein DinB [Coxiella burnetii]ABS77648.1 DinB family protein [Coxiella burnetii Dugway 5J108-111]OYK82348.1 hypothetical protein CbuD7D7780_05770 [Coxiella burnetii]
MKMNVIKMANNYFEYNRWANRQLLTDLKTAGAVYDKALPISFGSFHQLLMHIYYYDVKVYKKIVKKKLNPEINKNIDRDSLFELIDQYSTKWLDWARGLYNNHSNLDSNVILELSDLYNHNIYHRGQISAALAMLDYPSTSLDIYVYREQMRANAVDA